MLEKSIYVFFGYKPGILWVPSRNELRSKGIISLYIENVYGSLICKLNKNN